MCLLDLFCGGSATVEIAFLGGLYLGSTNAKKWSDHQRNKVFINNPVEALILVNEEHQGLLKLHVPLGVASVGEKMVLSPKEGIFFETEK